MANFLGFSLSCHDLNRKQISIRFTRRKATFLSVLSPAQLLSQNHAVYIFMIFALIVPQASCTLKQKTV